MNVFNMIAKELVETGDEPRFEICADHVLTSSKPDCSFIVTVEEEMLQGLILPFTKLAIFALFLPNKIVNMYLFLDTSILFL